MTVPPRRKVFRSTSTSVEIGSAALVNHVGLETGKSFRNSAAYCQSWLQALKNDKRFIVSAAGKADKAVNYILAGA